MKKLLGLLAILATVILFTGCASGPKYGQIKSTFPPLAADQGRIYFYRTTTLGAAVQPTIKLNDQPVGTSKAKGFCYADRPAGNFEVKTETEVSRKLTLTLAPGQTRYVRCRVSMGFFVGHVYPELVEPAIGEAEVQKCSYTGCK